jgi:hypothetical protein
MGDRAAAMLTKTQRTRIREDFAGRGDAEARRDRQRIRERLAAGVHDAELLVDYPDSEFELAFEDVADDELRDALVDAAVTVERARELHGVNRDAFVEAVAERTRELDASDADGLDSVGDVDVRPPSAVRTATAERVRSELGPDRWDRLANTAFRLGSVALAGLLFVGLVDSPTATNLLLEFNFVVVPTFLVTCAGFSAVLAIRGLRALKHDVVPSLRRLVEEPQGVANDVWAALRRPGRSLRRLWRSL